MDIIADVSDVVVRINDVVVPFAHAVEMYMTDAATVGDSMQCCEFWVHRHVQVRRSIWQKTDHVAGFCRVRLLDAYA